MKLEINNLIKEYGEIKALSNVSIELDNVSVLTLIGPSGGGKSTMLRVMGGLEIPDEGRVLINDEMVNYKIQEELMKHRQSNGFLFQSFNLFPHKTALENITLPLKVVHEIDPSEAIEKAIKCLKRFGLESHAQKMPYQLSGGQQQRVAIARAIINRPSLLLADEPTGALDSSTTAEVLELFDELHRQGITLVMVTHEDDVAARAQRIVRFQDGRIQREATQ